MQIKFTASMLLALGFVACVAWCFAPSADARTSMAPSAAASWPPAPRAMVTFDSYPGVAGTNAVPIGPNGSLTLVTVPVDRWLIITDYEQRGGWNSELVED